VVNIRRELDHISENYRRYHRDTGETVVWYEIQPFGSNASTDSLYDDVYDEGLLTTGGLRYKTGILVPVLQVQETEDTKTATPDGRHVVQTINGVVAVKDMVAAGVGNVSEYRNHLNDMIFYDGRYYSITTYRVRGRARENVLVVFEGIERYLDQEFVNDPGPAELAFVDYGWPATLPS
jgi:hypothetical protein